MIQVSIIIPTLNRCSTLIQTIKSITEVEFESKRYEIIVVDNGSTDKTKDSVLEFKNMFSRLNIEYHFEPTPGLLSGRHRGAFEAKGEIFIFIDDDILVTKNWLSVIVETFEKNPVVKLIGGKCLPKYEIEPPQWIEDMWHVFPNGDKMLCELSLCDYGNEAKQINPTWIFGLNFSIRKSTFFELGGFNPDSYDLHNQIYQGDGETGLSLKINKKKYLSLYLPNNIIYHQIPKERLSIDYFDKRFFFQGVCNSYTILREVKCFGVFYSFIHLFKKQVKRKIKSSSYFNKNINHHIYILKLRFELLEEAGFKYHQNVVKNNYSLLKWINKDNYLDYKLPILMQ